MCVGNKIQWGGGQSVFPPLGVQAELCFWTQQACEHLKEAHSFLLELPHA